MVKESASFKRAKRIEKLACAALEHYSMEEILNALYNAGDVVEFEKGAMLASDELMTKDGSGDIITIDMKGKGMNLLDKLREFLKAEIFTCVNEQQSLLFY